MNADDPLAAAERQQRLDNRLWDLVIAIQDAQHEVDAALREGDVVKHDEALARRQDFARQLQQLDPLRAMIKMIREDGNA